jgi:YesN/AraC family two-component response regulator
LTGYPSLETARQAKELGVQAYSVKPIEREELEETVARILSLPG